MNALHKYMHCRCEWTKRFVRQMLDMMLRVFRSVISSAVVTGIVLSLVCMTCDYITFRQTAETHAYIADHLTGRQNIQMTLLNRSRLM